MEDDTEDANVTHTHTPTNTHTHIYPKIRNVFKNCVGKILGKGY